MVRWTKLRPHAPSVLLVLILVVPQCHGGVSITQDSKPIGQTQQEQPAKADSLGAVPEASNPPSTISQTNTAVTQDQEPCFKVINGTAPPCICGNTSVDCSKQDLNHIHDFLVKERIAVINMAHGNLTSVKSDMFTADQGPHNNVQKIDLSHQKINFIAKGSFSMFPHLYVLDLSFNKLPYLEPLAFYGMNSLHTLDVGYNRLKEIFIQTVPPLPELRKLDLRKNYLAKLSANMFKPFQNIEELSLSSNEITYIHRDYFTYLTNLRVLDLSSNLIDNLEPETFVNLTKLVKIDISANPLHVLKPFVFDGPTKTLEFIDLSYMPILQEVQEFAFSKLHVLKHVDFKNSRALHLFHTTAFVNVDFGSLPELDFFGVQGTQLSRLSPKMLPWDRIKELEFGYSAWICDCHLTWMYNLTRKEPSSQHIDVEMINCNGPSTVRGRRLFTLEPEELKCEVHPYHSLSFTNGMMVTLRAFVVLLLIVIATLLGVLCIRMYRGRQVYRQLHRKTIDVPLY